MSSNADDRTDGGGRTSYAEGTANAETTGNVETTGSADAAGDADATGNAGTTGDADDSGGGSGINVAPTAVDDVVFTRQNTNLVLEGADVLLANDSDPDGGSLTVVAVDPVSAEGGTVIANDGTVTYLPAPGFWGTDAFAYTIQDDAGATATATVTVHVAPVHIPLQQVTAGRGGFALDGEWAGDRSGESLSDAGDVNGDGLDDVIVGAHLASPSGVESGRAYVVFGSVDTAAVQLSTIAAGIGGFALDGEAAEERLGFSVSSAGDINGDGTGDIIVAASWADPNGLDSGRTYVVFGTADIGAVDLSSIEAGVGGFVLDGESLYHGWDISVSGAGDVNGDGTDDIVIGAPRAYSDTIVSAGRTFVIFGKADTDPVQLSAITAGVGGFAIDGEAVWDWSGRSACGAGDVNGDGMTDIVLGAPGASPAGSSSGRSYVVFGKADTARVHLSAVVAGMGGFVLNGATQADNVGEVVSGAGDINGDGMDDVIVGARFADPNGGQSGQSYVVFGKVDTNPVELSAIAAGFGGFAVNGEHSSDYSGRSVSGAGDVNADGRDDIIVGANRADYNGSNSGRSYVVFGKADTAAVELNAVAQGVGGFVLSGEAAGDYSGTSVSGAGDVNADGVDDIIVGAYLAAPNGEASGRSYVVFGVPTGDN